MTDANRADHPPIARASGLLVPPSAVTKLKEGDGPGEKKAESAVEDMMREHGILRRALLVYAESVAQIEGDPANFDAGALREVAQLFRDFGEDHHERRIEEAYIFPEVRKTGAEASALVGILIDQHHRGREVTDYILTVTRRGKVGAGDAEPVGRALTSFVLMYQNHSAREDTVVFPAWATALSSQQLHELAETFERIEEQEFGTDGFEMGARKMAEVEQRLGLADLARFTPPKP